ncbi:MAG: hypothetical protein QOK10_1835, partial [Pseudonocardiales bacterium]|nr:hypothetical protein [Pseudonocardiales bacterium]
MPVSERPSLRRVSGFSVFWYFSVVVGWLLLATSLLVVASSSLDKAGAPLVMTAVLLVVLELLPLVQGRGHDPQGVVMSTAFVCAILLMWGIWPAVLVVSIAALASDLNVGKQYWKILFNAGQYNVSVAAGWLVMVAAGHTPTLEHPLAGFAGHDLVWVVGVWIAYFATNDILVSGALAWRESFLAILFNDFWHYAAMTFAVLALSPVVVILAQSAWILMPLLLIPLLLVYRTAQLSLEMEHQAGHDSLTGLPNRVLLGDRLVNGLARSGRRGSHLGVMFLDVDQFKVVNDSLGHGAGDTFLQLAAERINSSIRPGDTVARFGGDEFVVVCDDVSALETEEIAARVLTALSEPCHIAGEDMRVTASLGIALSTIDSTPEALL